MKLRGVVAAALLVGAAACGGAELPTRGPVALYEPSGEGGAAALLEGRLSKSDGCVVVESSGPTTVSVPLFPGAAVWSEKGLTFADRAYPAGSQVSMGGGYSKPPTSTPDDLYLPAACSGLDVFVVHQDTTSLVD